MYLTWTLLIFLSLTNILPASTNSISESDFIFRLKNTLEDSWDFETGKIDIEIKEVEAVHSKKKYTGFKLDLKSSLELIKIDTDSDSQKNEYTKSRSAQKNQIYLVGSKRFLSNPSKLSFKINKTDPWERHTRYKLSSYQRMYKDYSHKNYFSVEWKIPLMKKTNGANDFKSYQVDILQLKNKRNTYEEEQESFIAKLLSEFYDLALYQQIYQLYDAYINELSALELRDESEQQHTTLAILKADTERAKTFKLKEGLQNKISLSLEYPEFLDANMVFDANTDLTPLLDLENFVRWNSRSLKKIDIARQLIDIEIAFLKDQSRPSLDLTFSASHLEDTGSTKKNTFAKNVNEYHVGLEYNIPIMGRDLKNYKSQVAELKMSKNLNKYRRAQIELITKIKSLENSLINQKKTLNAHIKFRDILVENDLKCVSDYQNNESSVGSVIGNKKDALEEKVKTLEALMAYKKDQIALDNHLDRIIMSVN